MSEAIWQFFTRFVPIPPIFHSLLKEGPFTHCLECDRELIQANESYLIERVFGEPSRSWNMRCVFNVAKN